MFYIPLLSVSCGSSWNIKDDKDLPISTYSQDEAFNELESETVQGFCNFFVFNLLQI